MKKIIVTYTRMTALALIAANVIIISAGAAYSNDGGQNRFDGTGFMMFEEPVNPRNMAMGSAGAALGGAGFRYYNPAAPFFGGSSFVFAEFGQLPGGVNIGGFETAFVSREWFLAFSFHSGAVEWQTADERGLGAGASSGMTFGAMTAGYVRENFSLAASLNMAEDRVWADANYGAVAGGAGAGYKLFDGRLNLGAAFFHHVAWERGFDGGSGWESGSHVPRFIRGGAAWKGAVMSVPYVITADAVHSTADDAVTVPVGVEVTVLPYLNLRMGKRVGWDNEVMSFGLGIAIDKIKFDAAFTPTVFVSDYEMKWSMSFTYGFGD